ncbi:MAG: hypothetical protein JXM68_10755 [Sedimentisphaerales bacterium]|nr:hypothetical protein [Sedimentisphaerales bacterium]
MSKNNQTRKSTHKSHTSGARKKKLFTYLVVITGLVIGFMSVWLLISHYKLLDSTDQTSQEAGNELDTKRLEELDAIVTKSGSKAGQSFLTDEINKVDEPVKKSNLYIDKAVLAGSFVGGSDNEEALGYAYEAEDIFPNERTAYLIAFYEEKLGNISNAIKYYEIYISRLSKDDDSEDIEYYSDYVEKLKAEDK